MSAHLHAVPDPAPEGAPAAGERPLPVPAQAPVPVLAPAAPDDEPNDQDQDQDTEEEALQELPAEEPGEQAPLPVGRAFGLPDLRPYVDPRPLAELGPLAIQVGKVAAPPARRWLRRAGRGLTAVVVFHGCGLVVLARLTGGWLSGAHGKGPSVSGRLLLAAGAVYGVGETWATQPAAPWIITGGLLVIVVMASNGRIKVPADVPGKEAPAAPGAGLLAPLAGRRKPPAGPPEQAPAQVGEPDPEQAPTEAPEAPAEDPLTALIRKEIGTENGVHLRDLRPAMREALPGLSGATDKQLRDTLIAVGWDPTRTFRARGAAGRAGVHRDQLPPLPSPGTAPGPLSGPPLRPSPVLSPADSPPLSAGEEWSEEDKRRGFRSVPDPERGPAASKIQVYRG